MAQLIEALNVPVVIEFIKLLAVIVAAVASILTYRKTAQVKLEFNHKMDQFLLVTAAKAHAEGVIAGVALAESKKT